MGIIYIKEKFKQKNIFIAILVILITIQIIPLFVTIENVGGNSNYKGYITQEEYNLAQYLDSISEEYTVVLADNIITDRVIAYSKNTVSLGVNNDMINDRAIIELQKW